MYFDSKWRKRPSIGIPIPCLTNRFPGTVQKGYNTIILSIIKGIFRENKIFCFENETNNFEIFFYNKYKFF